MGNGWANTLRPFRSDLSGVSGRKLRAGSIKHKTVLRLSSVCQRLPKKKKTDACCSKTNLFQDPPWGGSPGGLVLQVLLLWTNNSASSLFYFQLLLKNSVSASALLVPLSGQLTAGVLLRVVNISIPKNQKTVYTNRTMAQDEQKSLWIKHRKALSLSNERHTLMRNWPE